MTRSSTIMAHFKQVDPLLYNTALRHSPDELFRFEKHQNNFERLCRSIIGQQLSTKAAGAIWQRFKALLPDNQITPSAVLTLGHDSLRQAGLSNAKARYVQGLADAAINDQVDFNKLVHLTDDEIKTQLIQLKGVGLWTIEMFLMFTLHREDIFSAGDLGLKRAIEKLYNLENPSNQELIVLAQKWSPYRTYACRILWASLDNNPQI